MNDFYRKEGKQVVQRILEHWPDCNVRFVQNVLREATEHLEERIGTVVRLRNLIDHTIDQNFMPPVVVNEKATDE